MRGTPDPSTHCVSGTHSAKETRLPRKTRQLEVKVHRLLETQGSTKTPHMHSPPRGPVYLPGQSSLPSPLELQQQDSTGDSGKLAGKITRQPAFLFLKGSAVPGARKMWQRKKEYLGK